MGIKETLLQALTVVSKKEAKDLTALTQQAMIAEGTDDTTKKYLADRVKEEVARLQPVNVFDHEEAMVGTNIYTSGRKGVKPKLQNIKGQGWIKNGH